MAVLSDLGLKALKLPEKGQIFYFDDSLKGFALRISQGGAKSFVLKHGRDRRLITIGRYPIISLSEARTEAKRLLAEFTLGKVRPQSITYPQAVDLFLKDKAQAKRPSTVYGYKLKLARLGFKCQLAEITPAEAARRLDRITAPSERSHVLVAGKVFFHWCMKRRYIEHNPLFGLTKPQSPTRSRVLSDDELKKIWLVCSKGATNLSPPFAAIVKLCILTGQRSRELSNFHHDFLEGDLCTFPSSLTKNRRSHSFPLAPHARDILTSLPKTTSAPLSFRSWSDGKETLDKLSGVSDFQIHDFRRSYATNMARLGISIPVIEKLLNHISGSFGGIVGVYQQHPFMDEMKAAVQKYEAWLLSIVG